MCVTSLHAHLCVLRGFGSVFKRGGGGTLRYGDVGVNRGVTGSGLGGGTWLAACGGRCGL